MKVFILTIAGGRIGYGHLFRMRALQKAARNRGWQCDLVVAAENLTSEALGKADIVIPYYNFLKSVDPKLFDQFRNGDLLLLDLSHPEVLSRGVAIEEQLHSVIQSGLSVVFVDSPGDAAILPELRNPQLYSFLYPYANFINNIPKGVRSFQGAEFAMLDPTFQDCSVPEIRENANRLLITFGGSDPHGLTMHALKGLALVTRGLEVQVIIGPMFAATLRAEIETIRTSGRHSISLIDSPESLKSAYQWCDLAISASGLTKYELAACGIPSILLSIDRLHDKLNQGFMGIGSAIDLGLNRGISRLARTIERLMHDKACRRRLSEAGQSVIDGHGTARILEILQDIIENEHNKDR